jgi:hypothetical protein
MKIGGLLLIALMATLSAHAESWTTTKSTCDHGFSKSYLPAQPEPAWRFHTLEECAIDLFTLDPVGPTMGNVGTGSGFGGGVHVKYKHDAKHILTLKALYSINSSYVVSGQYRIVFDPIRPIEIGPKGRGQTDQTKGTLDFDIARFDLQRQDFYGLGPSSSLTGHAVYRQQETWAGVNGYVPLPFLSSRAGIVGVLSGLKYLRPVTKGVTGEAFPSVNLFYGEAGAPASTVQPDFLELTAGLSIRTPDQKPIAWEKHEAQVMYAHYFEQGANQFSFDRLEAWGKVSLDILRKAKTNGRWSQRDYNRPWWKDAMCMQDSTGGCSVGTVTLGGRVTTSYSGSGSSVPFYLQPTLGGTDFEGVDTLRGLVDYRLRAPNRLLMQVDFDKPIAQIGLKKHPLGQYGLYTFFDVGNVAAKPGQLIDNGLRTDIGVGFSIAVQNKIVFRVYMAFGAGEGSHPNAKMANAF